ncbi:MAG: hypothetical protein H0V82_10980 [Candidatus Protochlamydia sp.]|nr:hypothetical protein [Candidatus Protochlamydia sp.]
MIGNPIWFKRRKYSGWGITPVTWQGWAYIGFAFCIIFSISVLTTWLELRSSYQIGILLSVLTLILLDALDIAIRMDKDERETIHEAFAERNAAWIMIMILGVGILFQTIFGILQGNSHIDPFMVAALLGGLISKSISNWYYLDK